MDPHPHKPHTQTYTQKYSLLNTENSKVREGHGLPHNIWQGSLSFEAPENSRILQKYKRFGVHTVSKLSLPRFFHEGKHAILRENLANESVRQGDLRQVLCIITTFCCFKPKNVCTFAKFSSFHLLQSETILAKCCKEVSVPAEFSVKQETFCV